MSEEPSRRRRDGGTANAHHMHVAGTAVRELVHCHYQVLYRYAYRLTGNVADAEDLTQQTFLSAQEKLHQLREIKAARSWLFQILRRLFLKARRKKKPHAEIDSLVAIENIAVETDFDSNLNAEFLQQRLDELPDHFRLALLMFYFEGKSYESIAKTLDVPLGTVMSRLARAKAQLRTRVRSMEAFK